MTYWRHKKRGSVYKELTRGFASIADMPIVDHTAVVVYRDIETGLVWVRNAVEFDDGRFEEAYPSPAGCVPATSEERK